jgi:hypothetical protein
MCRFRKEIAAIRELIDSRTAGSGLAAPDFFACLTHFSKIDPRYRERLAASQALQKRTYFKMVEEEGGDSQAARR